MIVTLNFRVIVGKGLEFYKDPGAALQIAKDSLLFSFVIFERLTSADPGDLVGSIFSDCAQLSPHV